ncbi:MAG: FapA family protein [Clostridiales bacterium]|nr:FapA family protein [Clostridiales bacterium]
MHSLIVEGDTMEKALEKGLRKLDVHEDEVDIEILEEGQMIMDIVLKPYKVLLTLKKEAIERQKEKSLYDIEFSKDGVFIKVAQFIEKINKEQEKEILGYIDRKGIDSLDRKLLFRAIYMDQGQRIKIAPPQQEKEIDEEVEITLSKDNMEAYINLAPPLGGAKLTEIDILRALNDSGIVFGIDEDSIAKLMDERVYDRPILVASGKMPKDGRDGRVEFKVALEKRKKPLITDDGKVDYFHLDIVENVTEGQLLATIIGPTKGEDGKNVIGESLPAKAGKEVRIGKGKNVIISDDGLSLYAGIDGRVELIGNTLHVYNTLEINGDVDTSTGNIDFIGNIVITGNILTGFEVKAKGHIKVLGVVEGARIKASGDVVVRQGIQGLGKGSVTAGGNIVSRFIENANIDCDGDIISEAIMHSNIQSGGKIQVAGRKGLVVGGEIKATRGIIASTIGSPMATTTVLEVGIDPVYKNEYRSLEADVKRMKIELERTKQALQLLMKLEETGQLSQERYILKERLLVTKEDYEERFLLARTRMAELEEIFAEEQGGFVSVQGIIYPGVQIIIGSSNLKIYEDERYVTFKRRQGDIVSVPFRN